MTYEVIKEWKSDGEREGLMGIVALPAEYAREGGGTEEWWWWDWWRWRVFALPHHHNPHLILLITKLISFYSFMYKSNTNSKFDVFYSFSSPRLLGSLGPHSPPPSLHHLPLPITFIASPSTSSLLILEKINIPQIFALYFILHLT